MSYSNPQSPERRVKGPDEIRQRVTLVDLAARLAGATEHTMGLDKPERQPIIPPVSQEVSTGSEQTAEVAPQSNVIRFPLERTVEQAPHTVYSSDAEARMKDARQIIEGLDAAA